MPKKDGSMDKAEADNVLLQRNTALSEVDSLKEKLANMEEDKKKVEGELTALRSEQQRVVGDANRERDEAVKKFEAQTTLITQGLVAVQTLMNALGGEDKAKQLRRDQLKKAQAAIDAELATLPE